MDLLVGLRVLLQGKWRVSEMLPKKGGRGWKRGRIGGETHREVFRSSIGIGDVPMDEGDAGFKGSLVLEINSGSVEDVEHDSTALWSCREFCSCASDSRGGTNGGACIVCQEIDTRRGDSWSEGRGVEEETS
jgi:hypothetical protein